MPLLETSSLPSGERELVDQCLTGGRLRTAKPKAIAEVQYIWRNIAFMISPKRQHNCMPFGCDFDLANAMEVSLFSDELRAKRTFLDGIVKRAVEANFSAVVARVRLGVF